MATADESLGGSHYTSFEELEVFINWGNELTHTDPEFAETLIESIVAGAEFEKQRLLPSKPEL